MSDLGPDSSEEKPYRRIYRRAREQYQHYAENGWRAVEAIRDHCRAKRQKYGGWKKEKKVIQVATLIGVWVYVSLTAYILRTANDTEERQLRAYVHMTPGTITITTRPDGALDVAINPGLKVFGQTPAGAVMIEWALKVLPWPMTGDTITRDYFHRATSTSTYAPGEQRPIGEKTTTLTPEDISKINAGTSKLYAYGTIIYIDVFKKARYTNFCFDFDMMGISRYAAEDCPIHNGADWLSSLEGGEKMGVRVPMR